MLAATLSPRGTLVDGWKRGAVCIDALCDHEVVRVDGGKLDADEDLVGAGSVGLGNVDILKTVDRVAKSCELNMKVTGVE